MSLKEQRLWQASTEGDLATVQSLLSDTSEPLNVNYHDEEHHRTVFFRACSHGRVDIVSYLVNDPRIDLNLASSQNCSPFAIACQEGHLPIVKLLLSPQCSERVDPTQAKGGATALFLASQNGHVEIVQLLLADARLDVNLARDTDKATPFYVACEKGHLDIIKLLLAHPRVEVNRSKTSGATPFYIVCQKGFAEIAKLLVADPRTELNASREGGSTPAYVICRNGHDGILELLLGDPRTDINLFTVYDSTPLWVASQNVHLSTVRRILVYGKDVDVKRRSAEGPHVWCRKTAAEIARQAALRPKHHTETEEEFQVIKQNGLAIAELLEAFELDPEGVRQSTRLVPGIRGPSFLSFFFFSSFLFLLFLLHPHFGTATNPFLSFFFFFFFLFLLNRI